MAADAVAISVVYFAVLLGFGVIAANILKKKNIPDTFFLLLIGLLLGPTVFANPLVSQYVNISLVKVEDMGMIPNFLRELALILVIFVGTFNLNFRVFKKHSSITIKLALVGVLFNTVVLGLLAHVLLGMDLIYALLLGAAISGTETSVIYAFESVLSKSRNVFTILKVESIFNSPISILVPIICLDLLAISLTPGAAIEPFKYLSQFWLMITAGIGTGLLIGLAVSRVFKGVLKEYTPLMLLSIALISYALSTAVGGSGMLSVAICGLVAGNFAIHWREDKGEVLHFQDQFSEMLRISVFTLLGAQVSLIVGMHEMLMMMAFFAVGLLVRPLMLLFLARGMKKEGFSRKDMVLLSLVTPRGLSAAAMIPIIYAAVVAAGRPELAGQMVNTVFVFIALSVLFSSVVARMSGMKRFSGDDGGRERKEQKPPVMSTLVKEAFEKEDLSSMLEFEEEKDGGKDKDAKGRRKKKKGGK